MWKHGVTRWRILSNKYPPKFPNFYFLNTPLQQTQKLATLTAILLIEKTSFANANSIIQFFR